MLEKTDDSPGNRHATPVPWGARLACVNRCEDCLCPTVRYFPSFLWSCHRALSQNARMEVSHAYFQFGLWTWEPWVDCAWLSDVSSVAKHVHCSAVFGSVLVWWRRSQWPRGSRCRSAAARLLRSWVRIPPAAWMFVCCECCVLSGRGICDELITRPEESN